MKQIIDLVSQWILANYHKWYNRFIIAPLLIYIASIKILPTTIVYEWLPHIIAIVVAIFVSLILHNQLKVQKHPSDKIGFDFTVSFENKDQKHLFKSDLYNQIQKSLELSSSDQIYSAIDQSRHATKLKTSEDVKRLMARSRACFMLWGEARERIIDGQPVHIFDLNGVLRHKEIDLRVSKLISEEMASLIGQRVVFDKENDFFKFEVEANKIELFIRYFTGISILLSGALDRAEQVLSCVKSALGNQKDLQPQLTLLKELTFRRLEELHKVKCDHLGKIYFLKRRDEDLLALEKELDKVNLYDPNWYSGYLKKALCLFLLHRDIKGASKQLAKCKGLKDNTWKMSAAFLQAYQGNLDRAWKLYQQVFRADGVCSSTLIECEEFIHLILEIEPERSELYYCLGIINLKGKEDFAASMNDFKSFIKVADKDNHRKHINHAKKYIKTAQSQMCYVEAA